MAFSACEPSDVVWVASANPWSSGRKRVDASRSSHEWSEIVRPNGLSAKPREHRNFRGFLRAKPTNCRCPKSMAWS